jgi:hypothetical protein
MTSFSVSAGLCALFAALALYGCANDDDGMGGAGTNAGVGGASGASGGAGGTTGGAGGTTGGAGGASGMTGGMGGAAGTVSGGAGGTGGGGAGGTSGMAAGLPGCEVAEEGDAAAMKVAATDALTGGCSFGSCHDADGKRAMLIVVEGDDITAKLVDKAACQVPSLMLVKSGGGQPALDGSWIWQKLAAPDDADMVIVPNDAWGEPTTCGQTQGTFGTRMPMTGLDLSETRVAAIRNWICAGAM